MILKCGSLECDATATTIENLRTHWAEAHIDRLRPVDKMLKSVDEHIASLEEAAAEGMLGHSEWVGKATWAPDTPQAIEQITTAKWQINKARKLL